MKRKMLSIAMALAMMLSLLPVTVLAADALPSPENGVIKLTEDVTQTDGIEVPSNLTIDLNGHNLKMTMLDVKDGVSLTITDTSADKNGKVTTDGANTVAIRSGGTLILENGTIENTLPGGNAVFNMGTFTIKGGMVKGETGVYNTAWNGQTAVTGNIVCNVEGGTVDASIWGVCVMGPGIRNGDLSTVDNGKLVVNISGGTIIAEQGIAGNASSGTRAGFTVNMTGGEIKDHAGNGTGMYLPSIGITNISGGSVTAAQAIRICAGELNVTGGTITCTAVGNNEDLIAGGSGGTNGAIVVGKASNGYVGDIKVNVSGSAVIKNTAQGSDSDIYPTIVVSDKNMAQTTEQSFKDPATGSDIEANYRYSETSTSVVVNAQVTGDIVKISNISSSNTQDGGNTSLEIAGGSVTGNVINQTTAGDLTVAGAAVTGNVKNNSTGAVVISDGTNISGSVTSSNNGNVAILDSTVTGTAPSDATVINSSVNGQQQTGDNYVALVNGKGYNTLQDAVNAVTTTEPTTITLLKDTAGAGVVVNGPVKRNLTFDLGGHTYTITSGVGSAGTETNGFQLIKNNNITFKNGTIAADPEEGQQVKILIQNYSNLTLENVTLDGTGMTDYTGLNYTLSNNNGEINLNTGTTIIPRTDDDIAMDVCWAASYEDGARVTVNEGAIVEGNVELGLWGQDAYEGNQSVLTVNGGTITGDLIIGKQTNSDDELQQVVESLKPNITINGGSFGASVDKFIDDTDRAAAKVQSGDTHSYYTTMEAALEAAQQGDSITDLKATTTTHTLTLKYNDNATADSVYTVEENTKVPLPTPSRDGYVFLGWYDADGNKVESPYAVSKTETLTAQWSVISSGTSYAITVSKADNGTVTASRTRANKGLTITLTVKADEGYKLDTITVTDKNGNELKLTDKGDGKYTFTMPASAVTVEASFTKDDTPVETGLPFTDVKADDWFYEAVKYAYDNKLMDGTSSTTFAPLMTTNRAMIVTILWRLEGSPVVNYAMNFSDVESGVWYTEAVRWAAAEGIVKGYSDTVFAPDDTVTREQLATILYRYAEYKEYDVSAKGDLTTFADGSTVSTWAADGMTWAVGAQLITGKDGGKLDPTGTATRAEVATILMRFCENVVK